MKCSEMRGARLLLLGRLTGSQLLVAQRIAGELTQWPGVVLAFDGPSTSESAEPNPFAADGNAAETSAKSGNKWRVHFIPDDAGEWTYSTSFAGQRPATHECCHRGDRRRAAKGDGLGRAGSPQRRCIKENR